MGASFTNYQAHTCDAERCAKTVAGVIQARALVTDAKNGWVSVYDERSESQDDREIERVAKELSSQLSTEIFAFLVHDSDIFMYVLYRKGKLVDRFNSRPDYFAPITPAEREKWRGHFEKLLSVASANVTSKQIQQTLGQKRVFEDELAAEFGQLMGINPDRMRTGFKYLQQEGHDFQLVHGMRFSKGDADLAEAVEKGDVQKVHSLLANHCSPNGKNQFGESLLVQALRCRRTEVAIALLNAGADPFVNPESDALLAASSIGFPDIVVLLLKSRTNKLKEHLPVALAHAVLQGHSEIVEELLKAGADPNLAVTDGTTPLMTACARGNETVREIVTGQRSADRPGAKRTDWPAIVSALLQAGPT